MEGTLYTEHAEGTHRKHPHPNPNRIHVRIPATYGIAAIWRSQQMRCNEPRT